MGASPSRSPANILEPPLSKEQITALQQACAPVGLLSFPAIDIIRDLRRHGYIVIVLGGVQITPLGLERLIRERAKPELAPCAQSPIPEIPEDTSRGIGRRGG